MRTNENFMLILKILKNKDCYLEMSICDLVIEKMDKKNSLYYDTEGCLSICFEDSGGYTISFAETSTWTILQSK